MKRTLFFGYIALLLPLAIACQKEDIMPLGNLAESSETFAAKPQSCASYFYFEKSWEGQVTKKTFGNAQGNYIIVGFDPDFTPEQQQLLLSNFEEVEAIEFETAGVFTLFSLVRLEQGSTCKDAEALMLKLKNYSSVHFAYPTFGSLRSWQGICNELLVTLEGTADGPASYAKLEKLATEKHVRIIDLFFSYEIDNIHYYIYILSADKNSSSNTLEMCTFLNKQKFVKVAEPNLVYSLYGSDESVMLLSQPAGSTAEQLKQRLMSGSSLQ